MRDLIIIGAGGHGRVISDIARSMEKYSSIKFLDDAKQGELIIDKVCEYKKFIDTAEFIVGIGDMKTRERLLEELISNGAKIATLVHKQSILGDNVCIDIGTVVMAGVVINNGVKIGKGVIVNTGSSIDHDGVIGDYTHVSIGVRMAGTVKLGDHVIVGPGAIIEKNKSIIENTILGAGAVVVKDITESGAYVGVPAKLLRK